MLKLENSIRGLSFSRVAFDLTIQGKKIRLYNKCWGDTTTVSLPTLFFCKKISIQGSHALQ